MLYKRQPQFESDADRKRIVDIFTWKEAVKLLLLWAIGIAGMIWIAMDGYKHNW